MKLLSLNAVEPSTHFLALAILLIVAGFLAFLFAGAALYERTAKDLSESDPLVDPDPESVEIDITYYPDSGEDLYR